MFRLIFAIPLILLDILLLVYYAVVSLLLWQNLINVHGEVDEFKLTDRYFKLFGNAK